MGTTPLISCLTVTTERLRLLKDAIGCYLAQSYAPRELVIVAGGSARYQDAVRRYLDGLGRADIRLVPAGASLSLGAYRNLSMDHARGEFLCQWDDDDLYHPERLRLQYEALCAAGADACFLTDLLQYFSDERSLYWLDWMAYAPAGPDKVWLPGSILVRRDPRIRYPETGGVAERGEDNALRTLVFEHLQATGLGGRGYLYVYRYHGRNAYARAHHQALSGTAVDARFIQERAPELRRALAAFPLPLPYIVRARGGAPVFHYNGPTAADRRPARPAFHARAEAS
ncbi:MAG TPA: glycosyltransferase family A protein [Longimicrobiales bacterium]